MQELTENVQSRYDQISLTTKYRRFDICWKQGVNGNALMSSKTKGLRTFEWGDRWATLLP